MWSRKTHLVIFDSKLDICMDNTGKETKHIIHIFRRIHSVRNGEECNFHKTVWCEGGLQLADIGTKNVREDKLNTRFVFAKVRLDNLWKNCQRGVTGYIRFWRTMCSEQINWIE